MRPRLKGTAADSVGKAIYVLILFFLPAILFARSDSIRFQKLSPRHAPAPRNVSCILQDHIGFLWFGTDNGLYRYDGRTLVVHRNSRENPKSICSNAIKALCEDSMGNLWVGTERGLNRFDRTTSTFTRYMADSNNPSGMISNGINTMIIGRSGTLWVGSWEGLSKYDSKADTFTHFRNDFRNPTSLSCNIVETIFEDTTRATDSETVLWIGTGMLTTNNGGLNRFDRKSGTFTTYKHDPGDITSLADNWVTAVRRSRKGILWVGTNGGLDRFDEVKKKFIHYRFDQWKSGKRGSNHVKAIHEDASGILWIGTWGGGLVRFDQATETFQLYMNDPDDDASLSNNNVVTLSEDITGTLWVGTFGGGICRLDRTRQPFRSFVHDEHLNSSLRDNLVYSIIEDRSGMVLLGTGTGLDVFDPRAEVFTHYYPLSGFPVLSLLEDVNGTLWTGLLGGLTKIQPVPFKRHFYGMYGAVSSIYRGREGILWMFSYDGLFQFHPTTGHFVSMNLGQGLTESAENLILDDRAVSKEGPRGLWIGSNEGLFHYDALTEALTRYANDSQKPNSLATDLVRSLYQDKNGILWVGTDRGLQQLDPQSGTFKRPSGNGGLPNDYVLGILEDDQGRLWLSTNTEIWRYDPRTSLVTNYDAGDGVPSNQFKPGSCLRSSTGDMYFGGNK